MTTPKIEDTAEFDFVKMFVSDFESTLPTTTSEILRYVNYGIGMFQGVIANSFINGVKRQITSRFKDRMEQYPISSIDWREMDETSRKICRDYTNFNPEVAEAYKEENGGRAVLKVLLRKNLSVKEIEEIVATSERWREFLFRVKEEFGENVGGGWDFEYPMIVEGLALRVNPALERDYKDTGTAVSLWYVDGEEDGAKDFAGLTVDGFRRAEELRTGPKITLTNLTEDFAKSLVGKRVDYHLSQAIRADYGVLYFGNLVRIL